MMPSLFATVRNEADNTACTPERLCRLSVAIGALPPAVFRFRDSAHPTQAALQVQVQAPTTFSGEVVPDNQRRASQLRVEAFRSRPLMPARSVSVVKATLPHFQVAISTGTASPGVEMMAFLSR
jgi:hypothetical protein